MSPYGPEPGSPAGLKAHAAALHGFIVGNAGHSTGHRIQNSIGAGRYV